MFISQNGVRCANAERVIDEALSSAAKDSVGLEEVQKRMRTILDQFSKSAAELPDSERRAILLLLYRQVISLVFDIELAMKTRLARRAIAASSTRSQRLAVLASFQEAMTAIEKLHGI